MALLGELFATGRIVDIILVLVVMEGLALWLWHRRTGRGLATGDILACLLPGACVFVALRLALVDTPWPWIALCLAAALAAHLTDVGRRLRR